MKIKNLFVFLVLLTGFGTVVPEKVETETDLALKQKPEVRAPFDYKGDKLLGAKSEITYKVEKQSLEKRAVDDGYGYKFANLEQLTKITEGFNKNKKTKYSVKVPVFVGIPSQNIQEFLKNRDVDVQKMWGDLQKKYLKTQDKESIFEKQQYQKGFFEALAEIEKAIKDVFDNLAKDNLAAFNFNKAFNVEGVDEFIIELAKDASKRLMVRSTGKEDTDKLANAGGNETVANVVLLAKNILEAMGVVVSSYFGKKSLTQRLGAKDSSLFEEAVPFCPALFQLMIGEKDPKKLPKCGVMFTEEPEGGISRAKTIENDRIKTTGIHIINAGYGHNEGVVNSLIPTDGYRCYPDGTIFPIICPKTLRVKPKVGGGLGLVRNAEDAKDKINVAALSKDAVKTLHFFGQMLEYVYGMPMDVEFVIDEDTLTIYIVQARPIVHVPLAIKPQYIDIPDKPDYEFFKGDSIGVAGGGAWIIESTDEIVVAETIGKALAQYQDLSDRKKVKVIIVGVMAPPTSHEATTFRSELKPVLCLDNWENIQKWIEEGNPLYICTQQATVINWAGKTGKPVIRDGWCSYPVPALLSIDPNFWGVTAKGVENKLEAFAKILIKGYAEPDIALLQDSTGKPAWKKIIRVVASSPDDALVRYALSMLFWHIHKLLKEYEKGVVQEKNLSVQIKYLAACVIRVATEVVPLIKKTDDRTQQQRLFLARMLEALLLQRPEQNKVIFGYSLHNTLAEVLTTERKIAQEKKVSSLGEIQMYKLEKFAMEKTTKNVIGKFVDRYRNVSSDYQQRYLKVFKQLAGLGIAKTWLNTAFVEKYQKVAIDGEISENAFKELVETFEKDATTDKTFLETIRAKKEIVDDFKLEPFDTQKGFKTQWKNLKELIEYFIGDEFLNGFKQASTVGKFGALGCMTKFIDVFDISIKTVSRCNDYGKDKFQEKAQNVKAMLDQYALTFKTWYGLIPENKIPGAVAGKTDVIEQIEKVLSKPEFNQSVPQFTQADLDPTPGFNSATYTLGSAVNLNAITGVQPKGLEDAFMVIHQSILVGLGALALEAGVGNIRRPELLEQAELSIKSFPDVPTMSERLKVPSLIAIDINPPQMSLLYNLPLMNHSAQFKLEFEKKAEKETVLGTIRLFGHGADRWFRTAVDAAFLDFANVLKAKKIEPTSTGVEVVFIADDLEKCKYLGYFFAQFAGATFGRNVEIYQQYVEALRSIVLGTDADVAKFLFFCVNKFAPISIMANDFSTQQLLRIMESSDPKIQGMAIKIVEKILTEKPPEGYESAGQFAALSKLIVKTGIDKGSETITKVVGSTLASILAQPEMLNINQDSVLGVALSSGRIDYLKMMLPAILKKIKETNASLSAMDSEALFGPTLSKAYLQDVELKEVAAAIVKSYFDNNKNSQWAVIPFIGVLIKNELPSILGVEKEVASVLKLHCDGNPYISNILNPLVPGTDNTPISLGDGELKQAVEAIFFKVEPQKNEAEIVLRSALIFQLYKSKNLELVKKLLKMANDLLVSATEFSEFPTPNILMMLIKTGDADFNNIGNKIINLAYEKKYFHVLGQLLPYFVIDSDFYNNIDISDDKNKIVPAIVSDLVEQNRFYEIQNLFNNSYDKNKIQSQRAILKFVDEYFLKNEKTKTWFFDGLKNQYGILTSLLSNAVGFQQSDILQMSVNILDQIIDVLPETAAAYAAQQIGQNKALDPYLKNEQVAAFLKKTVNYLQQNQSKLQMPEVKMFLQKYGPLVEQQIVRTGFEQVKKTIPLPDVSMFKTVKIETKEVSKKIITPEIVQQQKKIIERPIEIKKQEEEFKKEEPKKEEKIALTIDVVKDLRARQKIFETVQNLLQDKKYQEAWNAFNPIAESFNLLSQQDKDGILQLMFTLDRVTIFVDNAAAADKLAFMIHDWLKEANDINQIKNMLDRIIVSGIFAGNVELEKALAEILDGGAEIERMVQDRLFFYEGQILPIKPIVTTELKNAIKKVIKRAMDETVDEYRKDFIVRACFRYDLENDLELVGYVKKQLEVMKEKKTSILSGSLGIDFVTMLLRSADENFAKIGKDVIQSVATSGEFEPKRVYLAAFLTNDAIRTAAKNPDEIFDKIIFGERNNENNMRMLIDSLLGPSLSWQGVFVQQKILKKILEMLEQENIKESLMKSIVDGYAPNSIANNNKGLQDKETAELSFKLLLKIFDNLQDNKKRELIYGLSGVNVFVTHKDNKLVIELAKKLLPIAQSEEFKNNEQMQKIKKDLLEVIR